MSRSLDFFHATEHLHLALAEVVGDGLSVEQDETTDVAGQG